MKIVFVYPEIGTRCYHEPHLGLCIMAALLREKGHQAVLFRPLRYAEKTFLRFIEEHRPGLVAFSSTTHQYPYVRMYLRILKEHYRVPTVIGGIHATMASEEVIAEPHVDIVCRGEGEMPLIALARAMSTGEDFSRIEGLWTKAASGEVIKNDVAPLIQDLDALPLPDRDFFQMESLLRVNGRKMAVLAGRGCPFSCSYCSNAAYLRLYQGKGRYVRKRTVGSVIEELGMLKKRYTVKVFNFQDEVFVLDKAWLKEFAESYRRDIAVGFQCLARPEQIDRETAGLLKEAGCLSVSLGIETGNEELRRGVLNRMTTNAQIVEAFALLKEAGIDRFSFNMLGVPGETVETMEESLAFARRLEPDWLGVQLYHPYPGTRLGEICKEKGLVKTKRFNPTYGSDESMLELSSISSRNLTEGYRRFEDYANALYIRHKYPVLYPFFWLVKPLLRTRLRGWMIELGYRMIHDRGLFRRRY